VYGSAVAGLVGDVVGGVFFGGDAVGLRLMGAAFGLELLGRFGRVVLGHQDVLLLGELAGELLELFDAGQIAAVFEDEFEEEFLAGFVEHGAADDLFAAGGGDELAR